jgi:hypothetical protein
MVMTASRRGMLDKASHGNDDHAIGSEFDRTGPDACTRPDRGLRKLADETGVGISS